MTRRLPQALALAVVAVSAGLVTGCGSTSNRALESSLAALRVHGARPASTPPSPPVSCVDPTASLRPPAALPRPGRFPAGSFVRRIERRGRLVVGVDQNTLLLGYLDPFTGRITGFEVDLLRQVAAAIFGDPNRIEFKAVITSEREKYVESGRVDVIADAVTITCARLQKVDFSTVYYDAGQRLLVPKSSRARSLADLRGKRVCATMGSTSLQNITDTFYSVVPYPVPQRTDCLVALQEGKVAAVTSDDAILLGFAAQDPYTKLIGPRLNDEPYGMEISKRHPDFVRFVNGVLARLRTGGTWSRLYRKWLGAVLGTSATPPTPRYRD